MALVEKYLGCSTQEVLHSMGSYIYDRAIDSKLFPAAEEYKWTYDAPQNVLLPKVMNLGPSGGALPPKGGGLSMNFH